MFPGVYHSFQRFIDAVQDLSITVLEGATSGSVSPSPAVDWDRTLICIRGHWNFFGAGVDGDLAAESYYLDLNGSDLRLNRAATVGDGDTTVYVSLITFKPGVIKKIHRGTVVNSLTNVGTTALSSAVDLSKVELRKLGAMLSGNRSSGLSRLEMADASTVRQVSNDASGSSSTAGFEVVERY